MVIMRGVQERPGKAGRKTGLESLMRSHRRSSIPALAGSTRSGAFAPVLRSSRPSPEYGSFLGGALCFAGFFSRLKSVDGHLPPPRLASGQIKSSIVAVCPRSTRPLRCRSHNGVWPPSHSVPSRPVPSRPALGPVRSFFCSLFSLTPLQSGGGNPFDMF